MKDKNVAGILALFFGWIGIHRFYLGQVGLGIFYALFFWTGISAVLGLIDAIVFFSMDKENFDIKYNRQFYRTSRRRDTDFDRRRYGRRERWEDREDKREYERARRTPKKQSARPAKPKRDNPFKNSGIQKYKDYDYDGAIEDFEKALKVAPKDVAVHFNLACCYSLNENAEKAFHHLDKAVSCGFNDFKKIKEHDALAYLRIQDRFEEFEKNDFQLTQRLEAPKEELLDTPADLLEQLKKLGELRSKGLLTEEEFTAQKKKLLG